LLPRTIKVLGYQGSTKVFEKTLNVPEIPSVNWWPVALAVAALLSGHYKKTTTTDSDGCVTTTEEWGVDFGGSSSISVEGGGTFNGDYIGFVVEREYPRETDLSIFAPVTQVEIIGTGLDEMTINDEHFSN